MTLNSTMHCCTGSQCAYETDDDCKCFLGSMQQCFWTLPLRCVAMAQCHQARRVPSGPVNRLRSWVDCTAIISQQTRGPSCETIRWSRSQSLASLWSFIPYVWLTLSRTIFDNTDVALKHSFCKSFLLLLWVMIIVFCLRCNWQIHDSTHKVCFVSSVYLAGYRASAVLVRICWFVGKFTFVWYCLQCFIKWLYSRTMASFDVHLLSNFVGALLPENLH